MSSAISGHVAAQSWLPMKNMPRRCAFADNPSLQRDYVSTTSRTICNLVGNRFHLGIDTINVSELDPPIAEDTIGVRELASAASLKKPLLNAVTLSSRYRDYPRDARVSWAGDSRPSLYLPPFINHQGRFPVAATSLWIRVILVVSLEHHRNYEKLSRPVLWQTAQALPLVTRLCR